jgi:cardiolipin synthase
VPIYRPLFRRQFAALAAATSLARCAAVPDIDGLTGPDGGLATHQPATSQASTDPLQQQYDLQHGLSASPLVFGNTVTLLPGGAPAFEAMFQALRAARDSINLEYFILADVRSGDTYLSDILLDKLRAGVKVNLIYDAYGSRDTPASFFDSLRHAGAKVIEFNPIDPFAARAGWAPNDRDHRKIMVVDGRLGFTGGVNLDKAYENPPSAGIPPDGNTRHAYWRDAAIRIEGPAVAELQKLFFGTWREQKAPHADAADYFPALPRTGVQTIRIIGSSPGNQQPPAAACGSPADTLSRPTRSASCLRRSPATASTSASWRQPSATCNPPSTPPAPPTATCSKPAPISTKCATP